MIGMRPTPSSLGLRVFAFALAILFLAAPFGASAQHNYTAQPHHLVLHGGEAAYAAQQAAIRGGTGMSCCVANMAQADGGSGCSAPSCASATGALGESFAVAVSARPLRDFFTVAPGSLSPFHPIPVHGPPRA